MSSIFEQDMDSASGELRARALYYYFGWQGGTVHQLADATGISVADILYAPFERQTGLCSDFSGGISAVRTCSTDWRIDILSVKYRGNVAFWHGVMHGFYMTGALDAITPTMVHL